MKQIFKKTKWILFFAALFLCACASSIRDFGDGETLLWKVSDENSHVWLLGSIHFADSSFYPLSKNIEIAFEQSRSVAVEMDVSDEETQNLSALELERQGKLSPEETLQKILPDSTWDQFVWACHSLGISEEMFQSFRPWMAATFLSSYAILKTGIRPELGIDAILLERASSSGKEIIALETPKEQVSALALDSNDNSEGIFYLEKTLSEMKRLDEMIENITRAWKTGDLETLRKELSDQGNDSSQMKTKIYDERNEKMLAQIEKFLADDSEVFVIVGAGHLILGEENIIRLLRKRGYTLKRF